MSHFHPCNFRCHRFYDQGWGEAAFEYRWDSTSGVKAEDGVGNPDLHHCFLYELTTYEENEGFYHGGFLHPPSPPFINWQFRDPTDGRSGPVGQECFVATQGWAWDRHKLGGRLLIPQERNSYSIAATQQYRFHCALCGIDTVLSGSDAGPHRIVRTFAFHSEGEDEALQTWRYSLHKHRHTVWMDVNPQGYVADSAGIGFGPM